MNQSKFYYRLWDKPSLERLLSSHRMLLPLYRRLTCDIQRIFFFQYLLLYHFGGIVAHCDMLCNQNIEPLLEDARIVLAAKYDRSGRRRPMVQVIYEFPPVC
jgi:mannosyltransferase OCH1-like enzyme